MQPYQPKTLKLLETGIEALEKGFYGVKFNAIECYFVPKHNRLIAKLTKENGEKEGVGYSLHNKQEDHQKNMDLLENGLADEIKIYFALKKWLEVVPPLAQNEDEDEEQLD